jgi:PAS domain S-box-containing protein
MLPKSFRIPFCFLITGILWALYSHRLLGNLEKGLSPAALEIVKDLNHFGFVIIFAVILYFQIKKQQKDLSISEEHYRNLFERNPNPMWIFRADTLQFVMVNQAAKRQYGYSDREFLSMTVTDIRPESEKELFIDRVRSLKLGLQDHNTWRHLTKGGEVIYVSIVSYQLVFDGHPCRLAMGTNVTDMMVKEEKIENQNAALHEIAWINSHEVRKSLCSVMSLTALLKETSSELERQQYIDMIDQCTEELDAMLRKANDRVDALKIDL